MRGSQALEVDSTVGEVKGEVFQSRLRRIVEEVRAEVGDSLPAGSQIVFHNTERGSDWGGWHTGNYPTRTEQASLMLDLGFMYPLLENEARHAGENGPSLRIINRLDLSPRGRSGPFNLREEPLTDFVRRAVHEAIEHYDDAYFFRNYYPDDRATFGSVVLSNVFVGELEPHVYKDGQGSRSTAILLVARRSEPSALVPTLVSIGRCTILDNASPLIEELPGAAFLKWDDIDVVVVSQATRNSRLVKAEPCVYSWVDSLRLR